MRKKPINTIFNIFAHTILGLVFLVSGVVKAIDPLGTVYKIEDYLKAFGGFCNELMFLAPVGAYGLIFAEMLLAGLLFSCALFDRTNRYSRIALGLTLAFYAVMTPLTLWIALTNPVSDCGCFGDAIVLTNWQTFWKNVVLIVLAAVAYLLSGKDDTLRGEKPEAPAYVYLAQMGAFFFIAVMLINYANIVLPMVDFRPYKVGNHIPTLMEIPEDAAQPIYETTLIYEKDGKRQEFTLANYPKGDSTWVFVDQKSKLVQKGYEAPIHDFELLTDDYEDITWDVLETEDMVTLCIMYDMAKSDPSKREEIERLARESDIFYVVTGSGEEERAAYGLSDEVQFCTCDPVTLKTIVRANPGIVCIQSGTIVRKYRL